MAGDIWCVARISANPAKETGIQDALFWQNTRSATVKSWYYSDDYIELTKLRQKASTGTLLVAEGVESHILVMTAGMQAI
ncbi:MAG: hypothetical protein CM1200mP22_13370 [Dehalococcoidia bacterium]|nr:MAG: hypothetical protein CM1200mP22_13370 [Dehalococcoidia bacterium]